MAFPDRPNPEARPQVGKMPVPRFVHLPNSSREQDRFIAIEAYSPSGNCDRFFLIHNFKLGDLRAEEGRNTASSLVARTLLQTGVQMAVAPAVLPDSSQTKTTVSTFQDDQWWGVYAKIDSALIRNFTESLRGILPEEYFERTNPDAFRAGKALAAAVLPIPPRPKPSSS